MAWIANAKYNMQSMPSIQRRGRRSKPVFFVNALPSSEKERSQVRRQIRRHVGNWTWDKVKQRPEVVTLDFSEGNIRDVPSSGAGQNLQKRASHPVVDNIQPIIYHPIILVEPFGPGAFSGGYYFQHPSTRAFMGYCRSYTLSTLWPTLTPMSLNEGSNQISSSWIQLSERNPAVWNAFFFGSCVHHFASSLLRGQYSTDSEIRLMELIQLKTIQAINQGLKSPHSSTNNTVLMGVASLASNTTTLFRSFRPRATPFIAPLASMQGLDIYSHIEFHQIHLKGLFKIIEMRGGIQQVDLPGLAAVISYIDIINASRTVSHPQYCFVPLTGTIPSELLKIFGTYPLESGFDAQLYPNVNHSFIIGKIFEAIRFYMGLLEVSEYDEIPKNLDLKLLIDCRNLIQHHILSLPKSCELGIADQPSHIYEIARLAIIIYGVGVIFPIAGQNSPLTFLAGQLQILLKQQFENLVSAENIDVVIWAVVLGGIAAVDDPYCRRWFTTCLRSAVDSAGVGSWNQLQHILSSVAWFEPACTSAGLQLWQEAFNVTTYED
ncbi:hypothetical protein F5884DRAFT_810512 [Xylogone sp. PMI_703]|nr:hypothetical protein F5884DRAFT_810512 [Xylogone sp. PMI_703]